MTLSDPNLDDLRFQSDLVDEARKRIIRYCPEWTEYNLSDPGITLIELFAWMTELMVYRLNRVPEKNYIKFLEMLGLQRFPASSARTELTFWLSATIPFTPNDPQTITVPQGFEVRSASSDEEILFTTDRTLKIVPPLLTHVRTDSEFNKNHFSRLGLEIFHPFTQQAPREGNTFYLGFDPSNEIAGHLLQLVFECEPTEAVGIRREDPPWVWECLMSNGKWCETKPSSQDGEKDTTGGLNNENGGLVIYLPMNLKAESLYGLNAIWLRCRIEQRNALQGMYTESPRVKKIDAFSVGATTSAMHSIYIQQEFIGNSTGEPGQSFKLSHSPILSLQPDETLEVEETRGGDSFFMPWKQVNDFSKSTRFDRHFVLNYADGVILFGPSVRQPDGTMIQYGRIPENGRSIRFSCYRYGGGARGNLPAGSLTSMTTSLAYISRVTNLVRAVGGRDQETMDELKLRAQRELQAQRRAVTAQDYEQFTLSCSRSVARAHCLPPSDTASASSGMVSVLVVPAVADALQVGNLAALHMQDSLRSEINTYLDQYRLLTTILKVREPRYVGVKVKGRIIPQDFVSSVEVEKHVCAELQRYLTPLTMDSRPHLLQDGEKWEGWQFGRDLFVAEVISLIQQVPSVKYVLDVEIFTRPVVPLEEKAMMDAVVPPSLTPVDKVLQIPDDTLLCSLDHEILILSIEDLYKKG